MNKIARKIKAIPVMISVFIRSMPNTYKSSIIKSIITCVLLEFSLWITNGQTSSKGHPLPIHFSRLVRNDLPRYTFIPTTLLVLSVKGIADAYGASTGPIISTTLPTPLPFWSTNISPDRVSLPEEPSSRTISLLLFARCITSPTSWSSLINTFCLSYVYLSCLN